MPEPQLPRILVAMPVLKVACILAMSCQVCFFGQHSVEGTLGALAQRDLSSFVVYGVLYCLHCS